MIIKKTSILLILLLFLSCSENNPILIQEIENYIIHSLNTGGSDETLDIATWNIEYFPKHELTIDYVQEAIDSLGVDIIALQEITSNEKLDNLTNSLDGNWISFRSGAINSNWGQLAYLINTHSIGSTQEPYTILEWEAYGATNAFAYKAPFVLEFSFNNQQYFLINVHFKCCGDGTIDQSNIYDEELRRLQASLLLYEYINEYLPNDNVIVLGDLNDELLDSPNNNVFQIFIDDSENYLFADIDLANTVNEENWSFPNWPSHIDHILITNELFDNVIITETALINLSLSGGWGEYDTYISDHRPVVLSLDVSD